MKTLMLWAALAQAGALGSLGSYQLPAPPATIQGVADHSQHQHSDHLSDLRDAGLSDSEAQDVLAAWNVLKDNYAGSLDENKAFQNAVVGVGMELEKGNPRASALKGLMSVDLYSTYFSKQEYDAFKKESADSSRAAYGVWLHMPDERTLRVGSVQPGSPAGLAGIQPGDQITAINGLPVASAPMSKLRSAFQARLGSEVTLTVSRYPNEREVTLKAVNLTLPVVFGRMMTKQVGYVQISIFEGSLSKDLESAVRSLERQGARQLIVDLRQCPGGLVSETVKAIELFLPRAAVSGFFLDKKGEFKAVVQQDGPFRNMPLAVLVDGQTASGAEAFALAMKDQQRATLFGSQTYGKGSMQGVIDFKNGEGLKMTVGRWYGPAHTNVDGVGVAPHRTVSLSGQQSANIAERLRRQIVEGVSFEDADPVIMAAFGQ